MENKKTKIISIASIIALALTLVTATFAYFMAQTGEGKSTDIKINASTVDTFTFATGSAISLNLNQDNFASGAGNQTGTTFAKAMLTANNKKNTATEHYYMYLNISENTFTYTQDENTPEILLTIKDASGNAVTSISGLTYKTVTDGKGASISGFDITTKSGLITLFDNREITTTSSKIEEWNVTVTFVNYDADQSANAGKNFNSKILVQKEKLTPLVINNVTATNRQEGNRYVLLMDVDATANFGQISKYYYSIDGGETFDETTKISGWNEIGLDDETTRSVVVYAVDANGNKSDSYSFDFTPERFITMSEPNVSIEKIQYDGEKYDGCVISFNYTSKYDITGCVATPLETVCENNIFTMKAPVYFFQPDGDKFNISFHDSGDRGFIRGDRFVNGILNNIIINNSCEILDIQY